MMRDGDWNRCYISLVSEAKPKLSDGKDDAHEVILWGVLNELGGKRLTLEQIVKQCEYRRWQTKFPLRNSVKFHLHYFEKRKIVKIEF